MIDHLNKNELCHDQIKSKQKYEWYVLFLYISIGFKYCHKHKKTCPSNEVSNWDLSLEWAVIL